MSNVNHAAMVEARARHNASGLSLGHVGNRPRAVRTNFQYGMTGRPMSLGQGAPSNQTTQGNGYNGCQTFPDPTVPGCPGYNGCGDTVGINATVGASATNFLVQVQAAIVFTPRYFLYTGAASTFEIVSIKVANGPDSTFGAPYAVDVYALASFTAKDVSWPVFYNAPPLEIRVNNLTAGAADFTGVLLGVAAHQ